MNISYAQNFEDIMLWRALGNISCGFYIDVGANDPTLDSTTRLFYDHGWNGINLEPSKQWFLRLEEERARDVNLELGAGATNGVMEFYEFPDTGLSTLDAAVAQSHEASGEFKKIVQSIQIRRLAEICAEHAESEIHFLKVDVEGTEKDVLLGMDFERYRPWIVVVESTLPLQTQENYSDWEYILLGADYVFVYFDGLNRFYVAREKHQELGDKFTTPPNVFDDFETYAVAKLREENSLLIAAATAKAWEDQYPKIDDAGGGAAQAEKGTVSGPLHDSSMSNLDSPATGSMAVHEDADKNRDALIQKLENALSKAEKRIIYSEKTAEMASIRAVNAELELDKQGNTIRELVKARDQQYNTNKLLTGELAAFKSSVSWRLTAPVRWASRPMYWLVDEKLASSDELVKWLVRTAGFRSIILALAEFSPNLRHALSAQDQSAPGVGMTNSRREGAAPIYFNSTRLSPRAVKIYEDLKDAVARSRTDQS